MRVLLTGSTGRLGGAFLSLWGKVNSDGDGERKVELRPLTRNDLNLANPDGVRIGLDQLWKEGEFDVIVNPAAVSGLEECLDHPDLAQAVNVDSPRVMAEFCAEKKIQMVHFSTDYVFAGEESGRKSEADEVGPVNAYGRSKLAGELAVMQAFPEALVCRVSWLFGPSSPDRPSHFDHVLRRAMLGEHQRLIADKFSVPTFTYDIVAWVEALLKNCHSGIYHLCNAGEPESWLSYAETVCDLATRHGFEIKSKNLEGISLADATFFRERRPQYTAMLPERLIRDGVVVPRDWRDAAEEYLKILKIG